MVLILGHEHSTHFLPQGIDMYSRSLAILGVIVAAVALAGCSTKNYGRQPDLTSFEKTSLSCREIDLEQAKVKGFIQHVNQESGFDGRSVLSFLGDFGIGNTMEKHNALASATTRLAELDKLRSTKCTSSSASVYIPPPGAPVPASSTMLGPKSKDEQIYELQQNGGISYEEYQYRYREITNEP
ncbi:hypothetical protein [Pseudomonas graminis]|nr:hypothetical protein [Pseudomonas graminis]